MNIAFQAMRLVKQGATTRIRDLAGNDLNKITPDIVAEAARQGDPFALEIWEREAFYLGVGIANLIVIFNPEMIILGGGISEAFDLLVEGIRKTLKERIHLGPDPDKMVVSGTAVPETRGGVNFPGNRC